MKLKLIVSLLVAPVILIIVLMGACTQAQEPGFPFLKGSYLGQKLPGSMPQTFAQGIVTTDDFNHSSISMTPDGNEIFWSMAPIDSAQRIYSSKCINGKWTKPEIISFSQVEDGDCPFISPDGKKMFFNSNRPITPQGKHRERIWCVDRTSAGWGTPFPVGPEINAEHLHWQTSINNKGDLYFGSERSGSKGLDDVFMAEYINGTYKKPVSLPSEINSEEHEGCPFISPDGGYIIFARNGLRISYKQKDGSWTKSKSLGVLFDGICPYVSPDGKYLFYLTMGMKSTDVKWVAADFIEKLRPIQ